MGLLNRVKGSTLMETLVATVLIVMLFIMASLVLNNLLSSAVKNDTTLIEARMVELEYLTLHEKITVPYFEEFQDWSISINELDNKSLEIEAFNKLNNKTVNRQQIIYAD